MKFDPKEQVEYSLRLCMEFGITALFVEAVAYQATLAFWIEYWMKQLGIDGITVYEIYPGNASKNSRIFNTLKTMAKEREQDAQILVHKSIRSVFVNEAQNWNPLKTNNVDNILDLPTYCHRIMLEHAGNIMRTFDVGTAGEVPTATHGDTMALSF